MNAYYHHQVLMWSLVKGYVVRGGLDFVYIIFSGFIADLFYFAFEFLQHQ